MVPFGTGTEMFAVLPGPVFNQHALYFTHHSFHSYSRRLFSGNLDLSIQSFLAAVSFAWGLNRLLHGWSLVAYTLALQWYIVMYLQQVMQKGITVLSTPSGIVIKCYIKSDLYILTWWPGPRPNNRSPKGGKTGGLLIVDRFWLERTFSLRLFQYIQISRRQQGVAWAQWAK